MNGSYSYSDLYLKEKEDTDHKINCLCETLYFRLNGLPLYDSKGDKMKLTALEALKEFSKSYKMAKTVKYDAFDYAKAISRAIDYVLGSRLITPKIGSSYTLIFYFVEYWFCPKLNNEDHKALSILEKTLKERTNLLNNYYYSPITYEELEILLNCVELSDKKAEIFILEKYIYSKLQDRMKEITKLLYFLNGRLFPYLTLEIVERMPYFESYNKNYILDYISKNKNIYLINIL